jgi:hypothetical protein
MTITTPPTSLKQPETPTKKLNVAKILEECPMGAIHDEGEITR